MHANGHEWETSRAAAVCAILVCASVASAHENWIHADCFGPEAGQTVKVHLCSGHYYPKSSFAVQDKVLQDISWQRPDGTRVSLETVPEDMQRTGTLTAEIAGAHILSFTLKRPHAPAPGYEGKAILVAGNGSDSTNRYAWGVGLELVPEQPVSTLRCGDKVGIFLHMDGRRVAGSISATVAGGKTELLTSGTDRPAVLTLRKAGRYLVTSSHEGRGASLVFEVQASEVNE